MMPVPIPSRFPVVAIDKVAVCLRSIVEMVLHLEMSFSHRLDPVRLQTALDRLLDAEPVLGCRLVIGPLRSYWMRLPAEKRANFTLVRSRAAYDAFLTAPCTPENGPQLTGCLYSAPDQDYVMLKISHEVADVGGLKETANRLADIYCRLGQDPGYQPQPNVNGSRSIWQILKRLPWKAFPQIYWNYLRLQANLLKPVRGFSYPLPGIHQGRPIYALRLIPADQVARLAAYGRRHMATLNDILLAAFFRAMIHLGGWDGSSRLHLIMTADLRRHYLSDGKAGGICNLSALEFIFAGNRIGADFAATLRRVATLVQRRKRNWLGLSDFVGALPTISLIPTRCLFSIFRSVFPAVMGRIALQNALTNLGPIAPHQVCFDQPAADARLIVPPLFPPLLALGVSGYAGRLWLSVGFYDAATAQPRVETLLDRLLAELPC